MEDYYSYVNGGKWQLITTDRDEWNEDELER